MKYRFPLLTVWCIFFTGYLLAQSGTWTWVNGSNTLNPPPVYGTQGVPGANVTPPGFYEAAFWRDLQGNFWIFGGLDDNHIETSDLWRYNPSTNQWTWMKGPGIEAQPGVYGTMGVPAAANNPPSCGYASHSWTDQNGDLWLWGGYCYDAGTYDGVNALWRYNIASNEWTWMKGSSTAAGSLDNYGSLGVESSSSTPGGRFEGNDDWVDASNELWFFGGEGNSFEFYNDMWKFDISTNNWAWMNGPQGTSNVGSYGSEGVESATNVPPCRGACTRWQDNAGNFYLFGGINFSLDLDYSDIWRYNTATNRWTWIAGDNTPGSPGDYNTYCTNNGKTGPGARYENRTPQVNGCSHAFISFGGFTNTTDDTYNDLWIFNVNTLEWRWGSGPGTLDGLGHYGTLGVPSVNNLPPARGGSSGFLDDQGNFWLLGGMTNGGTGKYNDLWKYTPDATCFATALSGGIQTALNHNPICTGDSTLLTLSGDSTLNISPASHTVVIDSAHVWLFPDSTTTFTITGRSACSSSDTAQVTVLVNQHGSFNYSLGDTEICAGNSTTLTVYGASGVSIFPGTGVVWLDTAHASLSPTDTTTYLITSATSICGTPDTDRVTVDVIPPNPVAIFISDSNLCYEGQVLVTTRGLTNVQFSPAPGNITWLDTSNALIGYFYANQSLTVSGLNSCGATVSKVFNLTVSNNFGNLDYTISPPSICQGDSALLTLTNATGGTGSPQAYITWIDSSHAWLYPPANTEFAISGYLTTCGGYVSTTALLRVIQPGQMNYSLSDSVLCAGSYAYLYIYGANNIQISPFSYTLSYLDSVDAYVELEPSGTTTYTITATSICGGNYTSHITIQSYPIPNYNLSPGSICKGDSSQLTLYGLIGAQISPSNGVYWADTAHAWLSPDTTTSYTITANSCEGLITYQINMEVFQPGVLNITADSVICSGGDAYVTVSGAINPVISPNGTLYETDSTDYYGYLYPTIPTTYTITGTSVCGGTVSGSFFVNIEPYPFPTLGSATICTGDSTTLSLLGLQNAQIIPNTGVRWINAELAELSPDSTTFYEITGNSCDGPYFSDITLTVVPTGGLNYTLEDTDLCPGFDDYLTVNGASNVTLLPVGSGTLFMIDSTDYYAYLTPLQTTTYTLTGTSICTGDPVSATFTVTVTSTWGGMTFSNPISCTGGNTTITFNGLTNIYLYPTTNVTWLNANQAQITVDSTITYALQGFTPCDNTFDTTFTLTVSNTASVQISANITKFCPGDSAQLCATTGFNTYNWSDGSTGRCITTTDAGNYYVTASDNGSCTAVSNQVTLTIYQPTPVTISVSGDTLTGYAAASYQWYWNGNIIPGATSAIYIAITPGSYTLEITDANGCTESSTPVIVTGVNDISESSIAVYPNPTTSSWQLTVDTRLVGSAVEIYDAAGQVVYKAQITSAAMQLSLQNAASGVYELRIIAPQCNFVKKLVKM